MTVSSIRPAGPGATPPVRPSVPAEPPEHARAQDHQPGERDRWPEAPADESLWREAFTSRPYVRDDARYEDWAPAYRYGAQAYARHAPMGAWSEAESRLGLGWNDARGDSPLDWDQARHAARDAWEQMKQRARQKG